MRLVGVVVAILALGCVRTQTETCGDKVCPEGTRCSAYLGFSLCVTPQQTADCEGLDEGDACGDGATSGFCRNGACLPIGCGNGRIDDPVFARDEECDDGNRISHDGCSSTCRDEQPVVEDVYPFGIFPVTDQSLVSDTAADELLMFGGSEYGTAVSSRTWGFADGTWRLHRTRTSPSPRRAHASAYDRRRQRVLIFGGSNTDTRFADTWEYDGTGWTPRQSATAPPQKQNHAMAYDPIRGVTVMFGGGTIDDDGDTWEWDGTDWRAREDALPQPFSRVHQAMAFDHVRGVMVMIVENGGGVTTYELGDDGWREVAGIAESPPMGGRSAIAWDAVAQRIVVSDDHGITEEMWSWDGQAWTSIAVPTGSDARWSAAMATGSDGRVVRVGGNASDAGGSTFGDVTRWDGAQWMTIPGPSPNLTRPAARTGFAAAYDPLRRRIVLFGGRSVVATGTPTLLADTWELGPGGWTRRATTGPAARSGHAMAYDAKRRQVVLFGDVGLDGTTWLWDGTQWTSRAVAGPTPRPSSAMAFDAKRGVVVLFGGGDTVLSNDTWEWDGETWTQKTPASPPPAARGGHALAYDPIRERVLLFGGRGRDSTNASAVFSDTWEWNGADWTRLQPAAVPTARFGHGLAWDPSRQRLMLLGGQGDPMLFNDPVTRDVWEWNGATWTAVPIILQVGGERVATSTGFDNGVLVIAQTDVGMTTQRLAYRAETPYETCTAADRDRDGLIGCEDPDCWSTCSPMCMPGSVCDPTMPRCGDGTCSPIESCRRCPADCGECPVLCGDGTCSAGEQCVGDCTE